MRIVMGITGCLLMGAWLVAQAGDTVPKDIVKYRQTVMQSQREHMAAATAIIQGKVDFADQLDGHARALEATTRAMASLFPEGSMAGETRALSAVWDNNAEFRRRAQDTQEKSAAFAKVVAAGDTQHYSTSLNDLLNSCKSCHKDFRKKE
jgi:cytochrome c556